MYGDDIIKDGCALKDLIETYEKYDCNVIGVKEVPNEKVNQYGIVSLYDNSMQIRKLVEKPKKEEAPSNLAGLGRYIFKPEIFDELDKMRDSFVESLENRREIRLLVRTLRSRVTDYIIEFKSKYPDIILDAQFGFSEKDLDSYDAIISVSDPSFEHYGKIELFTQRLCVKASANSPLRGRKLTLGQLSNQPFLSLGHGSASHEILLDVCKRAGFTPNIVMRCDDSNCYRKLLEEGIGLCISGENSFTDRSVKLDVTDFEERQTVYCYYKKGIEEKDFLRFLQFLKNKAV
jgi:DNA-binding transcriptional LysR family regulator